MMDPHLTLAEPLFHRVAHHGACSKKFLRLLFSLISLGFILFLTPVPYIRSRRMQSLGFQAPSLATTSTPQYKLGTWSDGRSTPTVTWWTNNRFTERLRFRRAPNVKAEVNQHTSSSAGVLPVTALSTAFDKDQTNYLCDGVLFSNSITWNDFEDLKAILDPYFSPNYTNVKQKEMIIDSVKPISEDFSDFLKSLKDLRLMGFISEMLKSLTFQSVSPFRKYFSTHHTLAPADATVQGPHQESMPARDRLNFRHVVFACEQPATSDGATALYDMSKAWKLLPADLKEKLKNSYWEYPMNYGMPVEQIPCVVNHEVTGEPCLQFYGFGKVASDCVKAYRAHTGKNHVRPDPYQYGINPDKDLMIVDANGVSRPFTDPDLSLLLKCIFQCMIVHSWSKGDILIVDNVRMAHGRLEGNGDPARKIHFAGWGSPKRDFDITTLKRP